MRTSLSLTSLAFSLLASLVSADVKFTSPTRSSKWKPGVTVTVEWEDSGDGPSLSDFSTYTMWLCVGSNKDPFCDHTIGVVGSIFAEATSAKLTIDPTYGEDGDNIYFIKMQSVAKAGGMTTNYTPRFSMSDMTGTFTAAQLAAQKVGDDDPPASTDTVADAAAAASGTAAANSLMNVPYAMQTGATRYAPMQSQPGKSITATGPRMQYPTSAYTVYKKAGPSPNVQTTITQPWDYKVTSLVNSASPAPQPDDMQKFLNRWKD